jgi:hypothetical protein
MCAIDSIPQSCTVRLTSNFAATFLAGMDPL